MEVWNSEAGLLCAELEISDKKTIKCISSGFCMRSKL